MGGWLWFGRGLGCKNGPASTSSLPSWPRKLQTLLLPPWPPPPGDSPRLPDEAHSLWSSVAPPQGSLRTVGPYKEVEAKNKTQTGLVARIWGDVPWFV